MIFTIFQVSGDRERWLTASVWNSTQCGVLVKRLFVFLLKQWEFYSCTCERPQHGFGWRRSVTGFAVTLVVTYSETDSVTFNHASVQYISIPYFCAWKPGRFSPFNSL